MPTIVGGGRRVQHKLNLPSNVRIRGTNLAPVWIDPGGTMPGFDVWYQMWFYFAGGAPDTSNGTPVGYGDALLWWKPALDDAKAAGCNCVRILGIPIGVTSGDHTQAFYNNAWITLLNYCRSIGLYVYAANIGFEHWGVWSTPLATYGASEARILPVMASWADVLSDYLDIVIGIDVCNEAPLSSSSALDGTAANFVGDADSPAKTAMLLNVGEVLRRYSGLPISYSTPMTSQSQGSWDWYGDGWFPHSMPLLCESDFLDYHMYSNPMNLSSDVTEWLNTDRFSSGKEIIFGEFGWPTNVATGTRTSLYTAVKNLIAGDTRIVGGLNWANYDMNTTTANTFGLRAAHGSAVRTDIGTPFLTIPVTR